MVVNGRNNDSPGKQQKGILPVNHVQRRTHLIVGYEFSNTIRQKELTLVAGSINQPYWWIFISFEACHYFFYPNNSVLRADDVSHSCHGLLWWVWWNVALLQSIFLGVIVVIVHIVPLTCDTLMYCCSECDYTNPQCLLARIWYRVLCLYSWLVRQHHLLLGSLYSYFFERKRRKEKMGCLNPEEKENNEALARHFGKL